jgi:4-hydroxythreonine-4-phosphate dehydrogenase
MNPTRRSTTPWIAVTTGDPAGVGPEIVAHLFAGFRPPSSVAVLVGAPAVMGPWMERFGLSCPVAKSVDDLAGRVKESRARVVLLDTGVEDALPTGRDSAQGGRHAGAAIEMACELARNHAVAGIVTAPISKNSLNLAEFHYPGHTEMLAHYLNSPDCQMMMVHENLRVVPVTRHLPLRDVPGRLTAPKIVTCIRGLERALREDFSIDSPRIAVAGLNPHAGDGGVIGDEERTVIGPALDALREDGIDVTGPMPADAMFQAAVDKGGYDAYVAMYHDQGLVPFKMAAQRRGVNVTIGLPVLRTSVDHGTAYDIAGRGIADTESLLAAYELAEAAAVRT